MAMQLKLDIVEGSEFDSEIFSGRIIRMALAYNIQMPLTIPDKTILIQSLGAAGMPQKGDRFSTTSPYNQYYCKRHVVRAIPGPHLLISIIYEYLGTLTIRDSSSLTNVPSQLLSGTFQPLVVGWTPVGGGRVAKALTINSALPLRHVTASRTIDYAAQANVLSSFGSVNDRAWHGLPKGYWLYSDLDGYSMDDGITYTYTCTFTTKQKESWLQFGYMEDDTGKPVRLDAVDLAGIPAARAQAYFNGTDEHNGYTIVGDYGVADFQTIFGIP